MQYAYLLKHMFESEKKSLLPDKTKTYNCYRGYFIHASFIFVRTLCQNVRKLILHECSGLTDLRCCYIFARAWKQLF